MKTNLNNWLIAMQSDDLQCQVRELLVCNDGTTLSVQASKNHYCSPRVSLAWVGYTEVEVWCVSADVPESWLEYGDMTDNPFAYIPVELVEEFIDSHGGIKE